MNKTFSENNHSNQIERRKFITMLSKAAGSAVLLSLPMVSSATDFFNQNKTITVGDIMDLFMKEVPNAPIHNTVDTLKSGSRDIVVTGVITTMFATIDIIKKAIALNANFIIAHEPTFYNHPDEVNWLQNDDVYQYKKDLLQQHNIAVWRNHDSVHSLLKDGVREGVLAQLGWKEYDSGTANNIVTIPSMSLQKLINHAKNKMNIQTLRYIGNLNQSCKKILLMPGSVGGNNQITAISKYKPDVLMCGEIAEWETAEYVRDARAKGDDVSLIVLGHIASEEGGSEWMKNWLLKNVPGIMATHVPAGNSLLFA